MMPSFGSITLLLGCLAQLSTTIPTVSAQTFQSPAGWPQDLGFFRNKQDMVAQTGKSIKLISDKIVGDSSSWNYFGWTHANGMSSMARYDRVTQQTMFKDAYAQVIGTVNMKALSSDWTDTSPFGFNKFFDDRGWWALALIDGFETYGNSAWLDDAVEIWTGISRNGVLPLQTGMKKDSPPPTTCNGVSTDGLSYWNMDSDKTYLSVIASVLFGDISARLCKHKSDTKYCDAAWKVINNFKATQMEPSTGVIRDDLDGDCKLHAGTLTYNSGVFLSLLSHLHDASNDDKIPGLINDAAKTVLSQPYWNTDQGVIKEGDSHQPDDDVILFRGVLMRGVYDAQPHVTDDSIKQGLVQYAEIQYNAITHNAVDPNNDAIFGTKWSGPFDGTSFNDGVSALEPQICVLAICSFPDQSDESKPYISTGAPPANNKVDAPAESSKASEAQPSKTDADAKMAESSPAAKDTSAPAAPVASASNAAPVNDQASASGSVVEKAMTSDNANTALPSSAPSAPAPAASSAATSAPAAPPAPPVSAAAPADPPAKASGKCSGRAKRSRGGLRQ